MLLFPCVCACIYDVSAEMINLSSKFYFNLFEFFFFYCISGPYVSLYSYLCPFMNTSKFNCEFIIFLCLHYCRSLTVFSALSEVLYYVFRKRMSFRHQTADNGLLCCYRFNWMNIKPHVNLVCCKIWMFIVLHAVIRKE